MKTIDAGNPTFEKLITSGNIYVDKTKYLYNLLRDGGTYYFCARPRRFGKTLTINTLEQIFRGRRELFKGLYIDSTDYDWKEYPVIHVDFGKCQKQSAEELSGWLNRSIMEIGRDYQIELDSSLDYDENFNFLIERLAKKEKVVILIDEYDKILSSNISNPEIEKMRDVLRGFFEVIKASYQNMKFVFITGVTKYSKVSIFSSMNNLNEISMDKPYACMFGFTEDEIETYFSSYIEKGCATTGKDWQEYLEELKKEYDGYRFSPETDVSVYNPVSVSSFFAKGGEYFKNYWIDTGGMKLLMDLARKVHFNIADDLEKPIAAAKIASFDIIEMATGNVTPLKYKALLLQSGYLTIKDTRYNGQELYLDFPNNEVREAYASKILSVYGSEEAEEEFKPYNLKEQFEKGNTQGIIDNLFSVYAAIPYREEQKIIEADYQGMFYSMMIVSGAKVNLEAVTNKGRIDAVVKTPKHVYVIEFKRDESAENALRQIKDKGYHEKYRAWSNGFEKKVHLLGINFSTEKRNIESWKEEILS